MVVQQYPQRYGVVLFIICMQYSFDHISSLESDNLGMFVGCQAGLATYLYIHFLECGNRSTYDTMQ